MILELNLVKVSSIDAKIAKLLERSRVTVETEADTLSAIIKFIGDNISSFTAVLSDQRLVNQLKDLDNLTITEFYCLRYMLANAGIDIWAYAVSEVETNSTEVPAGVFEYNVVDSTNMVNSFIPMTMKIIQETSNSSLTKVYGKVMDAFNLFAGNLFATSKNPLKVLVDSMKQDEDALGMIPTTKSTYANSILNLVGKDIRVITE